MSFLIRRTLLTINLTTRLVSTRLMSSRVNKNINSLRELIDIFEKYVNETEENEMKHLLKKDKIRTLLSSYRGNDYKQYLNKQLCDTSLGRYPTGEPMLSKSGMWTGQDWAMFLSTNATQQQPTQQAKIKHKNMCEKLTLYRNENFNFYLLYSPINSNININPGEKESILKILEGSLRIHKYLNTPSNPYNTFLLRKNEVHSIDNKCIKNIIYNGDKTTGLSIHLEEI